MKKYYIYILTKYNSTVLYVGVTNNLERRILEHKDKVVQGFTNKYNLNKLVYYEEFNNICDAIYREKQIKKWRRGKKDKLINIVNPKHVDLFNCHFDWSFDEVKT